MIRRHTIALLFLGSILLFNFSGNAQPWLKPSILSTSPEIHSKPGFFSVQKKFNDYWKDKTPTREEEGNADEGGYQQFRRWEWFMKQRTWPSGDFLGCRQST